MTPAPFQRALQRIRRNERGSTIVEFAIVAPVMCLMLVGAFDVGHTLYTRSVLQGVVQKVARDSTLESSDSAKQEMLDARVRAQAKPLANNADIEIKRRYYRTFSDAAAAKREDFTDSKAGKFANDTCDGGEAYEDANNNGVWDKDGGNDGNGGAKDAVVYTVTMTYPRMLPMPNFLGGGGSTTKLVATTVLKNQPYGDQGAYAPPTRRNCA